MSKTRLIFTTNDIPPEIADAAKDRMDKGESSQKEVEILLNLASEAIYRKMGFTYEKKENKWVKGNSSEVYVNPRPKQRDILINGESSDSTGGGIEKSNTIYDGGDTPFIFVWRCLFNWDRSVSSFSTYLGNCIKLVMTEEEMRGADISLDFVASEDDGDDNGEEDYNFDSLLKSKRDRVFVSEQEDNLLKDEGIRCILDAFEYAKAQCLKSPGSDIALAWIFIKAYTTAPEYVKKLQMWMADYSFKDLINVDEIISSYESFISERVLDGHDNVGIFLAKRFQKLPPSITRTLATFKKSMQEYPHEYY